MIDLATRDCKSDIPAAVEFSVKAALYNWRCKAADVFAAISVLVYLPVIILVISGHGPPLAWSVQLLVYSSYLVVVLSALLKTLDHRIRLYTMLSMAYLTAIAGAIAYPGPFMRALPIALPIIGLVLAGFRCGRLTTSLSTLVFLFTPFLTTLPALTRNLRGGSLPSVEPVGLMFVQGVGLTAMLLALMVLLERFYRFFEKALIEQHRGATDIERKVLELTEAHNNLAGEMDERQKLERDVTRITDEENIRDGHWMPAPALTWPKGTRRGRWCAS